jgi:hypothetical protein
MWAMWIVHKYWARALLQTVIRIALFAWWFLFAPAIDLLRSVQDMQKLSEWNLWVIVDNVPI